MLTQPGRAVPSRRTTDPSWSQSPSGAEAYLSRRGRSRAVPRAYRFGEGLLILDSEDASLRERFLELFGECLRSSHEYSSAAAPDAPKVRCTVEAAVGSPVVRATFEDPEPLEAVEFCKTIFEDRGYREIPGGPSPWRLLGSPEVPHRPVMAAAGATCLFDAGDAWQPLLGNLALNRVLRLQRSTIFTHAGSVSVAGRGILLPGGKGAGKTTLSLALAARGHGFHGDEIGAVRTTDMSLLPVRRAVSIRPGPSAGRVRAAIERGGFRREALPDGSTRVRAQAGEIFPGATAEVAPLRAIFFLGPRSGRAACPRIRPGAPEIARLPLSPATLWEVPAPRRFLVLMRLLGSAACFDLRAGDPDETAELIERTVEAL